MMQLTFHQRPHYMWPPTKLHHRGDLQSLLCPSLPQNEQGDADVALPRAYKYCTARCQSVLCMEKKKKDASTSVRNCRARENLAAEMDNGLFC